MKMVEITRANISMIKNMGKVSTLGPMGSSMMVAGKTANNTEKHFLQVQKDNLDKVCGKMVIVLNG